MMCEFPLDSGGQFKYRARCVAQRITLTGDQLPKSRDVSVIVLQLILIFRASRRLVELFYEPSLLVSAVRLKLLLITLDLILAQLDTLIVQRLLILPKLVSAKLLWMNARLF
jgi:hypothetical protein